MKFRLGILLLSFFMVLTRTAAPARAQDLRVFETAHYRIHTDLDDDLAADLGRRMDAMYGEYTRRLSSFEPGGQGTLLEAYIVHSKLKYLHIVGLPMAGTAGCYSAQRHLLAAFLDGQGRDSLRRTLQHEAFHQFAAQDIGPSLPIWLNEGLAQVFEEGVWTGDGFQLGQVPPRRIRQLRRDVQSGALFDFTKFLKTTPLEWAQRWRDPVDSTVEYNQAWAMTHFLIYATDEDNQPKYRSRLIDMLNLLRSGADAQTSFTTAFTDDIGGFQARFLDYANSLQPTELATLIENQQVLGDFLVQMKSRGRTFDTLNEFRRTLIAGRWIMRYQVGKVQWYTASDPGVYFRDADGRPFNRDEQFFELAGDRPLPDLVLRANGTPPLRTRFSEVDGKIEHETFVDDGGQSMTANGG